MTRGTAFVVTGRLLPGGTLPVLHVDGGGQWRLELPRRYRHLIGSRVEVEGVRDDFDILSVVQAKEADPR
ncbi:MAG TPA: DUF5818 domain-containing protein [Croceibacterium sp.]